MVELEIDAGSPVTVVVAPTDSPPRWKLDPTQGPGVFSPYAYGTIDVSDGDRLIVDFRPHSLAASLFRGSLSITVAD